MPLLRRQFFVHVVWIVGEYAAPSLDPRCNTTVMVQYHEVLEVFAYEVNMVMETAEAETVNAAYAVRCGSPGRAPTHAGKGVPPSRRAPVPTCPHLSERRPCTRRV